MLFQINQKSIYVLMYIHIYILTRLARALAKCYVKENWRKKKTSKSALVGSARLVDTLTSVSHK